MKPLFNINVESRKSKVESRGSASPSLPGWRRPAARSGMALVITLILLSVTLVMAVAFLALSRRDRSAVATTTDTAVARLAAESALAQAQAQIVANVLAANSYTNAGLIVSTNYINSFGFDPNGVGPTNVNYDYLVNGAGPLIRNEPMQNLANLQILPRVPVYETNYVRRIMENSFYLDLNRNGIFDTNNWASGVNDFGPGDPEWIGVLQRPDAMHSPDNLFISRYAFIAVPADGALDLNYIHNQVFDEPASPMPGIIAMSAVSDGYFRNQGVGTWELNLAAFLADLNTNQWDADPANPAVYYNYREPVNGFFNQGRAFNDAFDLLAWRYNYNYNSLAAADQVFPTLRANNFFASDGIDNYSDGLLQTNFNTNEDFVRFDNARLPWAGANSTNHYYDLPSDAFDTTKAPTFAANLQSVSRAYTLVPRANANPTNYYNRYTLYRMLAQLGTDSQPEQGKINLNYSNAVVSYDAYGAVTGVAIIPGAETNLVPWRPVDFFIAAADRMLKMYTTNWFRASPSNYLATYYGIPYNANYYYNPDGYGLTNLPFFGMTNEIPAFGITNIPVWVSNRFVYSPAVNRVLQLAANLYDASSTNFYPSVFRPIFRKDFMGNIFICGYQPVTFTVPPPPSAYGLAGQFPLCQPVDASFLASETFPPSDIVSNNVYGVPWIIGAKKYMPGLNQFSMVNSAHFTRRLQVERPYFGGPLSTNQMYSIGVTNNVGISFWNSYNNDYPTNYPGALNLTIYVSHTVRLVLTNSAWGTGTTGGGLYTTNFFFFPKSWPGSHWYLNEMSGDPEPNSFITNYWANVVVPDLVYKINAATFTTTNGVDPWETNETTLKPLPEFGLLTTNWIQAVIVDNTNVIDYVQLRGPIEGTNLTTALSDPDYADATGTHYLWSTNIFSSGLSWGIINQIDISSKNIAPPASQQWKDPAVTIPGITDPIAASRVFFKAILQPGSFYTYTANNQIQSYTNYELAVQAPYTAVRTIFSPYLYQVNDPLVHYLASDLDAGTAGVWANGNTMPNGIWAQDNGLVATPMPTPPGFGQTIKSRYQPWGKAAPSALQTEFYNFNDAITNLTYKDPLVWGSDYWDFPTNRYPSVGWIGRVHRGSPWQTVYLKAHNVLHPSSVIINSGTNTWMAWTGDYNFYDAANSAPLQDRLLFDLFTAAPNDNASRGQLSVNQTHLAAWSALLSGMVVITNTVPKEYSTIPPKYSWQLIQPAGASGLDSALADIVTNINLQRAFFTNADGVVGTFEHKGDVLSTLALTEQSPYLNWNNSGQQQYGISDEAYEWLPQQAMSLLDCPTAPRYVVYCFGQTLKPAPGSLVTSGPFFGLCTNYQVVAESSARAVVQVRPDLVLTPNGFTTNYTTTVESFNVLPAN